MMLEWVFVFGVVGSVLGLYVVKHHWLSVILMIEFAALSLFSGSIVGFSGLSGYGISFGIMSISACGAAVGLGVLVALGRMGGNDCVDGSLFMKF